MYGKNDHGKGGDFIPRMIQITPSVPQGKPRLKAAAYARVSIDTEGLLHSLSEDGEMFRIIPEEGKVAANINQITILDDKMSFQYKDGALKTWQRK